MPGALPQVLHKSVSLGEIFQARNTRSVERVPAGSGLDPMLRGAALGASGWGGEPLVAVRT
eukprot:6008436-Prorocentrum_lima.AAC.1